MRRFPKRITGTDRQFMAAFNAPLDGLAEAEAGLAANGARPARAKRVDRETPVQRAIIKGLHAALPPRSLVFHIPNGGARNQIAGAKLKGAGTLAGIPDLCCILPGGTVFFVEVKAPGGSLSPHQRELIPLIRELGILVVVASDLATVLDALRDSGFPVKARLAA